MALRVPGLAISLTILAIVFINFGIDELGDPRLRLREPAVGGPPSHALFRPRSAT